MFKMSDIKVSFYLKYTQLNSMDFCKMSEIQRQILYTLSAASISSPILLIATQRYKLAFCTFQAKHNFNHANCKGLT